MSIRDFTTKQESLQDKLFGGGLNTIAGPLSLDNNESSELKNIDFHEFGSFSKRSGYTVLNSTSLGNDVEGDGLHWFEYDSGGTLTRKAICVANGKVYKMDGLDGIWDDPPSNPTKFFIAVFIPVSALIEFKIELTCAFADCDAPNS